MSTSSVRRHFTTTVALISLASLLQAAPGKYYHFTYGPGRIMHAWVPDQVQIFRAVVIHMHGGQSSFEGGSAIKDLQWQALCHKWDAIFIAPEYGYTGCVYQAMTDTSAAQFLASLDTLSRKYSHVEIKKLPWCVWGHSCGGYWVTNLVKGIPGRCIAYFPRSGTDDLSNTASCKGIPMFGNQSKLGTDMDDANINVFPKGRAKGLLWNLSIDPFGSHDCRDSRLLAIPFFDEAMRQRLPAPKATADSVILRSMDTTISWLGSMTDPYPIAAASSYIGDRLSASWIPNQSLAVKWQEYMKRGTVTDSTRPDAPYGLSDSVQGTKIVLRWEADADIESGVRYFYIYRDGAKIGQVEFGHSDFGDASGSPNQELRFADPLDYVNGTRVYAVSQVNWSGLESAKSGPLAIINGMAGVANQRLIRGTGVPVRSVELYSMCGRRIAGFAADAGTRSVGTCVCVTRTKEESPLRRLVMVGRK